LVREAQALSQQGEHLFDPGIGLLMKLWGFHADEFKAALPAAAAIEAWLAAKPASPTLTVDGQTIRSSNRRSRSISAAT
jgi:thiamine biosynthesis lipoprotein